MGILKVNENVQVTGLVWFRTWSRVYSTTIGTIEMRIIPTMASSKLFWTNGILPNKYRNMHLIHPIVITSSTRRKYTPIIDSGRICKIP